MIFDKKDGVLTINEFEETSEKLKKDEVLLCCVKNEDFKVFKESIFETTNGKAVIESLNENLKYRMQQIEKNKGEEEAKNFISPLYFDNSCLYLVGVFNKKEGKIKPINYKIGENLAELLDEENKSIYLDNKLKIKKIQEENEKKKESLK